MSKLSSIKITNKEHVQYNDKLPLNRGWNYLSSVINIITRPNNKSYDDPFLVNRCYYSNRLSTYALSYTQILPMPRSQGIPMQTAPNWNPFA